MLDRRLLRVEDGSAASHADLAAIATAPCNDMVVDARGRAYVGNFGFDRHRARRLAICIAEIQLFYFKNCILNSFQDS